MKYMVFVAEGGWTPIFCADLTEVEQTLDVLARCLVKPEHVHVYAMTELDVEVLRA